MKMTRTPRASDAAEWCCGKLYGPDISLTRTWSGDSRELGRGDAFVAIKGARTDGHLYIDRAVERGAALLLVEASKLNDIKLDSLKFTEVAVIAADDTLYALSQIAKKYLEAVSPKVIGITGSVGKTTTRELSSYVLKSKYKVHSAIKSFNTVLGCSLTILAMPQDTEALILELGTNHFGEIAEMVSLFPLDTALITEVAPAHLEGFSDINGVLTAKLEICESKKLDTLIYNGDNEMLKSKIKALNTDAVKVSVGRSPCDSLRINTVKISLKDTGANLNACYTADDSDFSLSMPLFGVQHAYNAGFAIALAKTMNIAPNDAASVLSDFKPINGRGVCKMTKNGAWIVDEAYNASPRSMAASMDNVLQVRDGRKLFAVLGGMKELGESSVKWHKEIAKKAACFDKVLFLGSEWEHPDICLPKGSFLCAELSEVVSRADAFDVPNSVVLIKGSNSYELKKAVAVLTEGTDAY